MSGFITTCTFMWKKIGLLIWFDCCKKSWMPFWNILASDNCVESFDLPKKISTEMLLQLRKHNIAKNYSRKRTKNCKLNLQELSTWLNILAHHQRLLSAFFEFFKCHWPLQKRKGPEKWRKNTKPTLVDTSTWTHSKRRSTDNSDTL